MHKKLIKEIIKKGQSMDMEKLEDILTDVLDDIKVYDPHEYKEIEYKMYTMVHGDHLDEELARKWVGSMENKDGTKGEHWTYEQTSQYAGKHDRWDYYSVLNMIFSDYFNPKFDTTVYAELANDWLSDPDVPSGKTLRYYWFVVKG